MKLITVIAASALLATSAIAADLPTKVPVPTPSPVADPFVGWFLGGELGVDWGHASPAITGLSKLNPSGFMGGGNLSYRSAVYSGWYLGLQTDLDFTGGSANVSCGKNCSVTGKNSWLGATMVQIGYRILPDLLIYGEGGVGYGAKKASIATGGFAASDTEHGAGWALGAGADYNLRSITNYPLLATLEYRHIDLGSPNFGFQVGGGATIGTKTKTSDDALLAGLKWKFGQ